MSGRVHPLDHGLTSRHLTANSPVRGPVHTHSIEEMRTEALKIYDRQLEALFRGGCIECGEREVATIAYPPDFEIQLIENGRYPGVEATRAVEIRVRVRLLCALCTRKEALW